MCRDCEVLANAKRNEKSELQARYSEQDGSQATCLSIRHFVLNKNDERVHPPRALGELLADGAEISLVSQCEYLSKGASRLYSGDRMAATARVYSGRFSHLHNL